MYVANGKMLHPAQIFFDPKEQTDQIRRLSEKSTYFVPPSSKPRNSKKADTSHKDTTDERLSPIIVGTGECDACVDLKIFISHYVRRHEIFILFSTPIF